jgi:hypothetical protein
MLQTLSKPTYTHRPSFTSTDRLIRRGKHEVRYIPTSLVPEEVKVTLCARNIVFEFSYTLEEEVETKSFNRDVQADVGIHTGKIIRLSADFAECDFNALIARLDDMMQAVHTLRAQATRETVRKSYEVVVAKLVATMKTKIVEDRIRLSAMLQPETVAA